MLEDQSVHCQVRCCNHTLSGATVNNNIASLIGLTIGEVHVIFKLAGEYAALSESPLAYVEWFTPLGVRDKDIGMYSISRSTRHHRRRASIIPINQIQRTCHLIPVFGSCMNRTWNRYNVARRSQRFFVNPYLRHSDFVIFRFLVDRWLKSKDER
jgi:hypothetical protein